MKRPSEAEFGKALRQVELQSYVYRLPDPKGGEGVSNWKPCDFMVWLARPLQPPPVSAWFECKDTDAVARFPIADMRPSQLAGIKDAHRLGIPYWLAIWWRRDRIWTISDAVKVLDWFDLGEGEKRPTSIPRTLLESRFGVDAGRNQLTSTLKSILLGEV